jgi:hypothetical protein
MADVTNPASELSSPATNSNTPQGPRHRHPSDRTAPRPALTAARVGAILQTTASPLNHTRQTRPSALLRAETATTLPHSAPAQPTQPACQQSLARGLTEPGPRVTMAGWRPQTRGEARHPAMQLAT